jgi:uncharacterized protein YndB with AHSA1/START domain
MAAKTETHTFVYSTYIRTTPEKLWQALTQGDFSEKYWKGYRIDLEQRAGGRVRFMPPKGSPPLWADTGKVLACEPGRKLAYEFVVNETSETAAKRQGPSRVTFELQPLDGMVRLLLVHENLLPEDTDRDPKGLRGINNGWPAVLSSLKSLLETGQAIPLEACSG